MDRRVDSSDRQENEPSAVDARLDGAREHGSVPEVSLAGGLAIPEEGGKPRSKKDSFLEIVLVVLLALFLALLLKTYVAEAYMIRGDSMQPTFENQQRVMVQKLFYEVHRGDVVIFSSKSDPRKDLIKRVIGVPGDEVQIVDDDVYVNREKIEEGYITRRKSRFGGNYGPRVVPKDCYFVLGDNRPQSQDSRTFGTVPRSLLKGKVVLRWWPAGELETF